MQHLIVGLHGFTETGERFQRYSGIAELAAELNRPFLCPDAAWFRNWAHWPRPWVSADERMLLGLYEQHGRLVLVGFSDGANMAHTFALKHPDKVRAVVAYAGRVRTRPHSINLWRHKANPMRVMLLGNRDDRAVSIDVMYKATDLYAALGHEVYSYSMFPGGHTWNRAANHYIAEFLKGSLT